jgi:hypothetical protein
MGSISVGGSGRKYNVYAVARRLAMETRAWVSVDSESSRGM